MLSKESGVPRTTIAQLEFRTDVKCPPAAVPLALALGRNLAWLLSGQEEIGDLSEEDQQCICYFRQLSENQRRIILEAMAAFSLANIGP